MENSIERSDVSEISKKSKSLDLQSLYVANFRTSNGKLGDEGRDLKRKRHSSAENGVLVSGQGKRKRKSRKEVSLNSFDPVNKQTNTSLDAVEASDLNSVLPDLSKWGSKLTHVTSHQKNEAKEKDGEVSGNGTVQNVSSLSSFPCNLDDNVIPIPKRPRGFLRRKKFQGTRFTEQVAASGSKRISGRSNSGSKVGSVAQIVKLTGDSFIPIHSPNSKRTKLFDDFKENGCRKDTSAQCFMVQNGSAHGYDGHVSLKKAHRNGKRREPAPDNQNHKEEVGPSFDSAANVCKDLQEDDEENLEQNAARMLSSRFDPSCTSFSSNSRTSASQSMNGLSFLPSCSQDFDSSQTNLSAGTDSNSVDAAGRVLRPRKNYQEKGFVRKRRHFYEVFSGDLDAYWVLNRRIKVFWPLDQSWYFGLVNDYDPDRKLHHVKYDDRDEEWINLRNERFKLLLLPSEVPGKSRSEKSGLSDNHIGDENGDVNAEDDNFMGSYMESEPIISWLARSNRMKSSPCGNMKKQKTSCLSKNFVPPMLFEDTTNPSLDCCGVGSSSRKVSNKAAAVEKINDEKMAENLTEESTTCSNYKKLPFVYVRRRFRRREKRLDFSFDSDSECRNLGGSVTFLASVVDRLEVCEENNFAHQRSGVKCLRDLDQTGVFWTYENLKSSTFSIPLMNKKHCELKFTFPLCWTPKFLLGAESFWVCCRLLLLQCGMVTVVWPKVRLEMLFVDNVVGLRFFLFEGCLMQAVAFVCFILTTFSQPNEYGRFVDLQLPATSIRFKLSGFQDLEKQLVFVFYNFVEVNSSSWLSLDSELKLHCSIIEQLPLSECTYDNIKALQAGIEQLSSSPSCEEQALVEGSLKKYRQDITFVRVLKDSPHVNRSRSLSCSLEKPKRLPPFALSFAAAPSFFLSLHLKLLMERNLASFSFQSRNTVPLVEVLENHHEVMCNYSRPGDEFLDISIQNNMESCLRSASGSKGEIDALSICNDDGCVEASHKGQHSDLDVPGTSIGSHDSEKNEINGIVQLKRHHQWHQSVVEQCGGRSVPSVTEHRSYSRKSEAGSYSCLDGLRVQIPPVGQGGRELVNRGTQDAQHSASDLAWNMNEGILRTPNPTAPRSMWHRNRHSLSSSSFSYWADGKSDFTRNGFDNGSKKPRTQVSYLLPFGGYEIGSKPRSHYRRGRPYKRIRNDNEKRISDGSRSPQRHLELLSCDANILITVGDRGWRERDAQVVLEFVDHKDWRLSVKLSGVTKYTYKAHQFLQPGTPNRYTHAMMWKGGKEWSLEFPDRSQWSLFKEMHEECYNRNIRVASVKNIPIPGVCLIEECDDNGMELPFVRSSNYYLQVETEAEMALDSSRVFYDMDSDDDEWISKHQISLDANKCSQLEISEDMFEKMMDMFEKISYAQKRDNFTDDEIEELLAGMGPGDLIKAIHEHWRQKRRNKGMPLIRQLQPPLWERYQQQVNEWELATTKASTLSSGSNEKSAVIEKPPMFAFCLKPRGLEVPNKGSKQRSQRRFPAGGHIHSFSRDQDVVHAFGRKLNGLAFGEERIVTPGHSHESSDALMWHQTSSLLSPRDVVNTGCTSMTSDGSWRNHHPKLLANKSRKNIQPPSDLQVFSSYDQRMLGKRNGVWRWNMGLTDWPGQKKQYQSESSQRNRIEQLGGSDLDEFRLRDAAGAAQHASNMAKLKREKAQRLLYRADIAIHKAVVALMTAEAMKSSSEDDTNDDR